MPITFQPVYGAVQCQIRATFAGLPGVAIMTLKFKGTGTDPTEGDCITVNGVVGGWCSSDLAPLIADEWNIFALYAKSMAEEVPPFAANPLNINGSNTHSLHPELAPEILFHTGRAGRSYLGRAYCFAPGDVQVTTSGFTTTLLDELVGAFQTLHDDAVAAGIPMVVASPKLSTYHEITNFSHVPRITVQDRRRIGFGG